MEDSYELFAIRFATMERTAAENFLDGDPHNGPMPMDYFVWAAIGRRRTYVIDTGYKQTVAAKRGRTFLRCPVQTLREIGIDPASQTDVILTHMHYDHAGNFDLFPNARFHLQDAEMAFATGRYMSHRAIGGVYEVDDVVGLVRAVFDGRVKFHAGDVELAPGLSLHHLGGHTMGLQAVRVRTARGWVVVASDASHYFANMEQGRPFPLVFDVGKMFDGFARLRNLADSPEHIVPGHDPLVRQLYPPVGERLRDIIVRLDAQPASRPRTDR
jgi:glyoxylase-like metal-dependent hydrolase (beta-lactamase superfamily II)